MRCPHCGVIVESQDSVCPNCGSEICEVYTSPIPPVPEGEMNEADVEDDIYCDTTVATPEKRHFLKETGEALIGRRTMRWSHFSLLVIASLLLFLVGWIPASPEVSSIEVAATNTALSLQTDGSTTLNFQVYPENVAQKNLGVEVSDSSVIKAEIVDLTQKEGVAVLQVQITALREGSATMKVVSKNSSAESSTISVTVEDPPKISAIDAFSPDSVSIKKDDTYETSLYLAPGGLTGSDVLVRTADSSVASIEDTTFEDVGDYTLLTITIKGAGAGETTIEVGAADGKTGSQYLDVTVTDSSFSFSNFFNLFTNKNENSDTSSSLTESSDEDDEDEDDEDTDDSYSSSENSWNRGQNSNQNSENTQMPSATYPGRNR